jgi:hypothetical protein
VKPGEVRSRVWNLLRWSNGTVSHGSAVSWLGCRLRKVKSRGATAPVEIGVKEGKRGRVRRERDRTTRAARPGEDGGLHAGVQHDAEAVQEELGSKREKLGGREQLEKRRGRTRLYSRSMIGLADEASSDAMP